MISIFEKSNAQACFPFTIKDYSPESKHSVDIPLRNGKILTIHTCIGCMIKDRICIYSRLGEVLSSIQTKKVNFFADSSRDAEVQLSDMCDMKLHLIPFHNAKAFQPVTTPDAIHLAERQLPNPWHERFFNARVIMNPRSGAKTPAGLFLNNLFGYKQSARKKTLSSDTLAELIEGYLQEYKIHAHIQQLRSGMSLHDIQHNNTRPDCVIAAGGDGTINTVINALAYSKIPLAIIPLGTSNVFSIELDIPSDIQSACQLIAQSDVHTIDIGKFNNRFFTCIAGIGIDAYISHHVESRSHIKHLLGGSAYVIIGILDFLNYHFRPIHLTVDNNPSARTGYFVIIANGRHYGGKIIVAPHARLDDGLLDVVIFKSRTIVSIVKYLRGFQKGTLFDTADIEYLQAKKISISGIGHHQVHIDGENAGHSPATIEIAPCALNVIY
jgi:YegS/Rv2252/BmrU family lipid kinase